MVKVVLIQPPQLQLRQPRSYISLGIAYLAAVLEKANVETSILQLAEMSLNPMPSFPDADLYAITCVSATYPNAVKISQMLKSNGKRVCIGGIHPSIFPKTTLVDSLCDHVVVGEGEYALRDLALGNINKPIIYAGIIKDLDQLPFPARHLFEHSDVVNLTGIHGQETGEKATTMITSRGCPYNCSFCTKIPQTNKFRGRSAENIVEEIELLIDDYDITHVRFVDDIFTFNIERIIGLCKSLIKITDLSWVCITRADRLTDKLLKMMKFAGCKEIHLGIETGSQKILDAMNKRITVEQNFDTIQRIKRAGIKVKAYFLYGFPGELHEDIEATKTFVLKAKPDKFTLSRFTALPGSNIWETVNHENRWFYPDSDEPEYLELREWLKEHIS